MEYIILLGLIIVVAQMSYFKRLYNFEQEQIQMQEQINQNKILIQRMIDEYNRI